ncbi:NmrA-like protein [Grosmannia clavigera kw1407]|uniref:NmrA-like protein n=1 Tax=Grosmannia clavigera (strain kw1407 / UAMH 11150) TaxID=655863 RepID=F0XRD6_GROCL|nr:NmrA-like protein [Grosmannia clavigera kw1407]EFW99892.1 NmrA-like protein [Grosmannia clavigera kw1407]
MATTPLVFVVGGTGAQGIPVIRGLVHDGAYRVRFLTRDRQSARAQQVLALDHTEAIEGTFASEADLRAGFRGADYAFVNLDGFNSGEQAEMFWAMRSYELALEEGIRFFVYGNLDFVYRQSGYDAQFRCGHYDGKGRVGEWILRQNRERKQMGVALFTTGPYLDMAIASGTPMSPTLEQDVLTWRVPLGQGAVAHVDLDDCGHYVRWLLDHRDRADGLDLAVAIALIPYDELARAFERVTGHAARYVDTSLDHYWTAEGPLGTGAGPAGYNARPDDPASMTVRQNFSGFWNMWKASSLDNNGLVRRDFDLLDEIHPGRTRSAEDWLRKQEAKGLRDGLGCLWERVHHLRPVLKVVEDGRKGRL